MKKYIFITIGGKNIRVELDNEMQRKLKRTLKDNYQFDDKGCLKTNFEDKETTYKTKQIVFKNLLDQMSEFDLPPELKERVETLKSSVNIKKSTIYSSDLTALEKLFKETTKMYDDIKKSAIPKKSQGTKTEELKEKITNSLESNDAASNFEVATAALDEASKDKVMGTYLTSEKIDKALENIIICETKEEYEKLTSSNTAQTSSMEVTIDTITASLNSTPSNQESIFLPPDASTEDIVRSIISSNYLKDETGIEVEIPGVSATRNKAYGATLNSLLTDLVTNFTLKGITSRNISYFGLNFIKEYMQICEGNGADFERLLKGYFRGEKNEISLFIKDIIRYNGGDTSLRYLMESMLVEQAVNKKLISRDYLKKIQKPAEVQALLNQINAGQKEDNMNLTLQTRFGGTDTFTPTNSSLNSNLNTPSSNSSSTITTNSTNTTTTTNSTNTTTSSTEISSSTQSTSTTHADSTMSSSLSLENSSDLNTNSHVSKNIDTDNNVTINIPIPPKGAIGLPSFETTKTGEAGEAITNHQPAISGSNALDLSSETEPDQFEKVTSETEENSKIIPFPARHKIINRLTSTASEENRIIDLNNHLKNNSKKNNNINTSLIAMEEEEERYSKTSSFSEENPEVPALPASTETKPELKTNPTNTVLNNTKEDIQDEAKEVLKEEAKKKAREAILAFIKKNPWVIGIAIGIVLVLLIILIIFSTTSNDESLNPDYVYNGTFNNGTYWWPVGSSTTDANGLYSGEPISIRITSYFGPRKSPTAGASSNHGAIDIGGVGRDTPVIATSNGTVTKVIKGCVEGARRCGGGYGNYIMIDHGNGLVSLYAHLSNPLVNVGDEVVQGERIGITGSTGTSTGPHLHFEMRLNGTKVDPLNYVSESDPRPTASYSLDTGDIDINFLNFLHSWESPGPGATDTTYTVYADPGGVLTVGYGVTLKYNPDLFRARGIDPTKLKVGDKVNRQLVDSIELEIIAGKINSVRDTVSKCATLNEKQIYALVSRMYNTGNISSFCSNYQKYRLTESLYTNYMNKPITQKGKVLKGLIRRREAEWDLFYKGKYTHNG